MSKNPAGAAQQSPTGTNNTQPAPKRQDQKSTPEIPKPSATYAQVLALGKPAIPMPLNPIPPKPGVPAPLIPSRAAEQHHGANEKNKKNPSRKHKQPSPGPPEAVTPKGAPPVVPVKKERLARQSADDETLAALKSEAPDLFKDIEQQTASDARDFWCVELVCTPAPGSVKFQHDLSTYEVEKELLNILSSASGLGEEHDIMLESINSVKIDTTVNKKYYFTLSCTSESGLASIMEAKTAQKFRGYAITYFQQKESRYGYRFQYSLRGLPTPFSKYTLEDWIKVLTSQGWDLNAITHICFAKRSSPGEMNKITGMLDIYVKPEYCTSHGCEGCLHFAGTHQEKVGKMITCPPSSIVLGRNPTIEAVELIAAGLLFGQYYTSRPDQKPSLGDANGMMEEALNCYLTPENYGKLYLKQTIKIGSCKFCWGPKHASRNDPCYYSKMCKECLIPFAQMPNQGFHHSCRNLITSTEKPPKKETSKRKSAYDPGRPQAPSQATYTPSESHLKRQKILEEVKFKQAKRKLDEAKRQAAERAAREEYEALQRQNQVSFLKIDILTLLQEQQTNEEDEEDVPLTAEDIARQDEELRQMVAIYNLLIALTVIMCRTVTFKGQNAGGREDQEAYGSSILTSPTSIHPIYYNKQDYWCRILTNLPTDFLTNAFLKFFFSRKTTQNDNLTRIGLSLLSKQLKLTPQPFMRSRPINGPTSINQRIYYTYKYNSDLG